MAGSLYPEQLSTIEQVQRLARRGFDEWERYGWVNAVESGDLLLLSYNTQAYEDGRWNAFECMSRGLILNKRSGEVVARPFDKFFGWLEGGRRARGHIVTVTEKLDGSLGIHYRTRKGEHRIATRGTFHSRQATWATRYLKDNFDLSALPEQWTLLFEIIYPENREVVDYGDRAEIVLLAARDRFTGKYMPFFPNLYTFAHEHSFTLPQVYNFNDVGQIIVQTGVIDETMEGWVVEFSDGSRFKFKGDIFQTLYQQRRGRL